MTECDELLQYFQAQARGQVHLAVIALAAPVAAMHIDLAVFREGQARVVEQLCEAVGRSDETTVLDGARCNLPAACAPISPLSRPTT